MRAKIDIALVREGKLHILGFRKRPGDSGKTVHPGKGRGKERIFL